MGEEHLLTYNELVVTHFMSY